MFLDNRQVAMDSVQEALADSLDYFEDNAERLRPGLLKAFEPFYARRVELKQALETETRKHLSLMPRDADVERDDYMWLWSRLKSIVSNDNQVLINELLEQERVLMQACSTAFTHPLPDSIEKVLEGCFSNCRSLIRELYRHQMGQAARRRAV
ncbi:hypothetical protein [Cobetia crustatorum]|uniref:DUF2383 domain-containing protein n=1 Tax=Cobetia crustatorum TaxID=553385 RepID=A0A558HWT2_9GAMM|nr:hypothetical protein [Cobetia crustatorum]TVU73581.1 hypothetical protein FQP86_00405 [Cobetia crustatorum]